MTRAPGEVVEAFNAAINARDIDALAALMTDNHEFIDAESASIRGKEACVAAWRGFFAAFPEYRNTFTRLAAVDAEPVTALDHAASADASAEGCDAGARADSAAALDAASAAEACGAAPDARAVTVEGYSTCSVAALNGPALWSARVVGERVAQWRVYADTPENRAALALSHT
jgi:ketosteroid isomerase-like protein